MQYKTENIRNICLLGHGGNGKTSLAEALLYYTKGTDRLGKIADGTTVCDFDPEETKRGSGISAALEETLGARRVSLQDDGSALLADSQQAWLYIPN